MVKIRVIAEKVKQFTKILPFDKVGNTVLA